MELPKIGLVAVVILAVSSCASPAGDHPTPADTPSPAGTRSPAATRTGRPTPSPTATPTPTRAAFEDPQRCENDELRFAVTYPGDWWANPRIDGDGPQPIPACTYFAPDEVDLQPGTDDLTGVAIRFDLVGPDVSRSGEVISEDQVTVDGRIAVRVELEPQPQPGFVPEGARIFRYLVPLNGSDLVATADDIHHDAYEENKEILDRMMQTIEIDG